MEKKISENQLKRLLDKKATTNLKGFVNQGQKVEGLLKFTSDFEIEFVPKKSKVSQKSESMPTCPKCKKGTIIKGKTAYGCSRWKEGCNFRFLFSDIKEKAKGQKLTKELVLEIISA